jgi:hypothetical protein
MTGQRRDDRMTDAAVDAAWRQAASEQPPAEVDAAILAAARAAVRGDAQERKTVRARRRRAGWQPLAAAAGVIGLSFLLVQLLPRDQPARPPTTGDLPQAPEEEPAPMTAPPAPVTGDAAAVMSAEREAAAGPPPRAATEAVAKQSVAAEPESPAAWASRIIVLHEAGELAAAEAELRAFRAAYAGADDYLPEAVRSWATSVGQDGSR